MPHTKIIVVIGASDELTAHLRLLMRKAGIDPVAAFATLESVNDVPSMPVIRNRTHHIALLPQGGGVPHLPSELRDMLRFPPEILSLSPVPALVW